VTVPSLDEVNKHNSLSALTAIADVEIKTTANNATIE
jgi:hypothetical protein